MHYRAGYSRPPVHCYRQYHAPVSYTHLLLNRTDSAFVKGAVSGEDGSFVIDTSCNGGIIKVTSVGYKTVCKDCEGENVGIIKMEEDSKMLGEVVVKSSLPVSYTHLDVYKRQALYLLWKL